MATSVWHTLYFALSDLILQTAPSRIVHHFRDEDTGWKIIFPGCVLVVSGGVCLQLPDFAGLGFKFTIGRGYLLSPTLVFLARRALQSLSIEKSRLAVESLL